MNGNPTAEEKRWHQTVCQFAQESTWLDDVYGGYCAIPEQFQLDHIFGARAKRKVNGVSVKVGEWAVMPISVELHDITSNHALNRTLKPGAYRDVFGNEKQVFAKMVLAMQSEGYELPFNDDIFNAIVKG